MLEGFFDVSAILRCGIYALVREGAIVYIGQSRKPLGRIAAHRSQWGRKSQAPAWLPIKGILFDEIHVLPCRVEDLDRLERALIDLYKPRYNIKLKAPTPTTTPLTVTINNVAVPFNHPPTAVRFERRI
jgi:excinuclease UvrABC nuclease subunit